MLFNLLQVKALEARELLSRADSLASLYDKIVSLYVYACNEKVHR
jgi:hypothetical protein